MDDASDSFGIKNIVDDEYVEDGGAGGSSRAGIIPASKNNDGILIFGDGHADASNADLLEQAYGALDGDTKFEDAQAFGDDDGGRVFDVQLGGFDDAAEDIADIDVAFDDDAGDAGDDVEFAGQIQLGSLDAEKEEDALGLGGEESEDIDVEEEKDAASINKNFASTLAQIDETGKKRTRDAEAEEALSSAKRARVELKPQYIDPMTELREKIRGIIVSKGGIVTMNYMEKALKKEIKEGGKGFIESVVAIMKALTRRTMGQEGDKVQYKLKDMKELR
jgi:hypothetical protein